MAETKDTTTARRPSALGRAAERIATLGAMLSSGVMAGYFLAFSAQVMPGVGAMSGVNALVALPVMRSINDHADSPRYAAAFLGALILTVLATAIATVRRDGIASWLTIIGGAAFLLGSIGVTLIFNRRLDDDLSGWSVTDPASIGLMEGYVRDWSRWNDVRLVASLIAFGLFALAGLLPRRPVPVPAQAVSSGNRAPAGDAADPDWLAGV
jgi:uncharacterized membrane protein